MTDRELLELAAKAAGLELADEIDSYIPGSRALWIVGPGGRDVAWQPLGDDGDALRLAVTMWLSLDHNHSADHQRWVAADRNGCEGCYAPVSCVEDEFEERGRLSATRRAIVRAAAEIGKGMP